jgi:hypothetical protein
MSREVEQTYRQEESRLYESYSELLVILHVCVCVCVCIHIYIYIYIYIYTHARAHKHTHVCVCPIIVKNLDNCDVVKGLMLFHYARILTNVGITLAARITRVRFTVLTHAQK